MSWKSRQLPALVEAIVVTQPTKKSSTMIEHSINKYSVIIPTYTPAVATFRPAWMDNQPTTPPATHNGRQSWSYAKCLEYQKTLIEKGYTIGAKIVTKYGISGTIASFREIPQNGLDFAGYDTPNMFTINRSGITSSNLLYNEEELNLDTITTEEITC